jgi:hypothetical protein
MSNVNDFGYGQMSPEDTAADYNVTAFIVSQFIAGIATAKLVQVKAVHPGSGTPPALGTVDVQPLVSLVDGQGNASAHGTVFGIPYLRLISGTWEIVSDPAVGDVGLMVCCDRDSSGIVTQVEQGTQGSNIQPAPPGSNRKYAIPDGIYLGGLAGAQANNAFIELNSDGTLNITDSKGNVLSTSSSGFSLTGNVKVTGTLEVTGLVTADGSLNVHSAINAGGNITAGTSGSSVELLGHTHSGVTTGGGTSGPPTPGS